MKSKFGYLLTVALVADICLVYFRDLSVKANLESRQHDVVLLCISVLAIGLCCANKYGMERSFLSIFGRAAFQNTFPLIVFLSLCLNINCKMCVMSSYALYSNKQVLAAERLYSFIPLSCKVSPSIVLECSSNPSDLSVIADVYGENSLQNQLSLIRASEFEMSKSFNAYYAGNWVCGNQAREKAIELLNSASDVKTAIKNPAISARIAARIAMLLISDAAAFKNCKSVISDADRNKKNDEIRQLRSRIVTLLSQQSIDSVGIGASPLFELQKPNSGFIQREFVANARCDLSVLDEYLRYQATLQ